MHPKDADGMANSVDPDQTASSVRSWSALFAVTYLSQYIEFVRYFSPGSPYNLRKSWNLLGRLSSYINVF